MIICGASSSINLLSLEFLFITLLYRSFTSLTANFPPSKATRGLRSGGSTGSTVIIIHSGLFPLCKSASTIFNLFMIVFFFASELVFFISSFRLARISTKSKSANRSLTICPPISATKPLSPNL